MIIAGVYNRTAGSHFLRFQQRFRAGYGQQQQQMQRKKRKADLPAHLSVQRAEQNRRTANNSRAEQKHSE